MPHFVFSTKPYKKLISYSLLCSCFCLDLVTRIPIITLQSTSEPTTPYTHEAFTPPAISVFPYQPVDIPCTMFPADMDVTLWQESSTGAVVQRITDGVSLILQGNVFTIIQGRPTDKGTYYCQVAGSRKILSALLSYSTGKILKLCNQRPVITLN